MFKNDLLRRRQAKTRALSLGRKEWFEELGLNFSRYAVTGIFDSDHQETVHDIRFDSDLARAFDRFRTVANQIISKLAQQTFVKQQFHIWLEEESWCRPDMPRRKIVLAEYLPPRD